MNNIVALDLGTTMGWAMKIDGVVTSGSKGFKSGKFVGAGYRFLEFKHWLTTLDSISIILFEEVRRHIGTDAAHCYGGFLAVLLSFCEQYNIPYRGVPVKQIKKYITGSGSASKTDVIEAVKTYGYSPIDDNEADALALLIMGGDDGII